MRPRRLATRLLSGAAALALGWSLGQRDEARQAGTAHAAAGSAPMPRDVGEPGPRATAESEPSPGEGGRARRRGRRDGPPDLPVEAPRDPLGARFRDGLIMTGRTQHRLILFTFDDGPDRHTTPALLDRLDAAGVRAVFFLTGRRIEGKNAAERRQQEIARETARRGHLVASHTFTHRQLPLLDDAEAIREIARTQKVFERVLGARPWLFRPPGGAHSPRIDRLIQDQGYTTMLWNLGAGDFQVRTADDVYQTWLRVFERRQREGDEGGIILLHDTYEWSVRAFDLIMDHLMRENCRLLEQGEELFDIVDDPRYFFVPRSGQEASAEAPPATVAPAILEDRQARLRRETAQRCNSLAMR